MIWINNGMATFIGFSTVNRIRPPYSLTNSELVKRDLLNEFYTRLGERVMRPNFGSVIWDILMDPNTPDIVDLIKEDVEKILAREPRARLLQTRVFLQDHTARVEIEIEYVPQGDTDILYLEYQRKITEGIDT
jgi:phage baseplate assembly protein W